MYLYDMEKFVEPKASARKILLKTLVLICSTLLLASCLWADDKAVSPDILKTKKHPMDLSVKDLGFSGDEAKGNPQYQKDLETRSDMLQIHQTLGLITAVPMTAEFVLGIITAGNVAKGSTNTGSTRLWAFPRRPFTGRLPCSPSLPPKPKGLLEPSANTAVHVDLGGGFTPP